MTADAAGVVVYVVTHSFHFDEVHQQTRFSLENVRSNYFHVPLTNARNYFDVLYRIWLMMKSIERKENILDVFDEKEEFDYLQHRSKLCHCQCSSP